MKNLLTIFALFIVSALSAQQFQQVTHISGTQTIAGRSVTVTATGISQMWPFGCTGVNTYELGQGGSITYSFSSPVYHVRLLCLPFDGVTNFWPGDSMGVFINNTFYPLTVNNLSKHHLCNGNLDSPIIAGGKITGTKSVLVQWAPQLDIHGIGAINSVKIYAYSTSAALGYAFYFADTGMYISQPNYDTLFCPGDSLHLDYGVVPTFLSSNTFTAQLSNASGSFAAPINIGSITSVSSGTIPCKIPVSITAGNGYRIRLVSSNPVRTSDDNGSDIHIKASPAVPVATTNAPVCDGAAVNLFSSNAGTGVSYSWSGPGFTANVQNPSIVSASPSQSGDYIVTATLNGQCPQKDTVTVQVKPLPATPTATNNGPLCPGETLNLQGNSSTPGVSYNWSGPVSVPPVQNPSLSNVTPANDGIYTLSVSLNGCTAPNTATTTVTIKPVPAVPTASSNSPVCTGGILNLTAGSITPGVSYDWSGPNNFTSTQQNPVIDPVPAAAAGTYEVSATLNGCTSAKGSTTVAVNTLSYLGAYASPNDTICEGSTLTVVTVPTNGGSSPAFQWFKNNNPIAGATKVNYATTTAITGDTFYCRMIAGNICNTPVTLFSNKIGITVQQKTPIPWVSISSNPARPIPGNPVIFTATPTNGGSHPQYQWQRNGTDIAGATSDTWSSSGLNPYDKIRVRLTVAEPCPDGPNPVYSDSIEVNFPQSIGSTGNSTPLYLYPNPSNGDFVLEGQVKNNDRLTVEIINYLGQTVYREQLQPEHNIIHKTLQLHRQLAPGAYLLKAEGRAVQFVVY